MLLCGYAALLSVLTCMLLVMLRREREVRAEMLSGSVSETMRLLDTISAQRRLIEAMIRDRPLPTQRRSRGLSGPDCFGSL